ncbi:MAG: cysteine desulfurase family protein [Thermoguttaceae bacterium]|jgi:cysteine desulfurase
MASDRNTVVGRGRLLPGIDAGDSRRAGQSTGRIYLDFNASTPLAPEVVAAMTPYLTDKFGNPSSTHWAGAAAHDAVEAARLKLAMLVGCDPTEVVFTSGGTESNNSALLGAFYSAKARIDRPHFITTQIEHPAILEPCRFLERLGAEVTYLPVDRYGRIDPDDVRRVIRSETVLISVMHANNEVGTLEPIAEIAEIARERDVLSHTDAAQTIGKIPVDVETLGVDLLSIAGHKLYSPKGVGAIYVREGVALEPLLHGGPQEAGRRPGTESALLIVGLGAACHVAQHWVHDDRVGDLTEQFWRLLRERFGDRVVLNGHPAERLPNTLNVSFPGCHGEEVLSRLEGVAASTGSACHAGQAEMSPVLRAMGVDERVGLGAIRFSLGRTTTLAEVERVVESLTTIVR